MALRACTSSKSSMVRASNHHRYEPRQPIVKREFHAVPLQVTGNALQIRHPITFQLRNIENQTIALGRDFSLTNKKKHYIHISPLNRSLSTQSPKHSDNHKRENPSQNRTNSQGDNVGGHKIGDTTYGPNSPITKKNWIGGILVILIATSMLYLYCENNPDQELCASLRSKLGIKKTK